MNINGCDYKQKGRRQQAHGDQLAFPGGIVFIAIGATAVIQQQKAKGALQQKAKGALQQKTKVALRELTSTSSTSS